MTPATKEWIGLMLTTTRGPAVSAAQEEVQREKQKNRLAIVKTDFFTNSSKIKDCINLYCYSITFHKSREIGYKSDENKIAYGLY